MGGNKKGKRKNQQQKKREKSINPHKSNSKVDAGRKEGDTIHHLSGNNIVDDENEIQRLIYKKIEKAYSEVCSMLFLLDYNTKTVKTAMLGGYIIGEGNIVGNIFKNSIAYIDGCPIVDGEHVFDKLPIFNSMIDLITFWVEELVNFAVKMYPNDSKCDAMRRILSSKFLDVEIDRDYNLPNVEGSSSNDGSVCSDEMDFDDLLKKNIHEFEGIFLTCSPVMASSGKKNDVSSPQEELHPEPCVERNQSLKDLKYFDQINLNPFESLPKGLDQETNFEELLKNSSADQKDEMISNLENLVISLEKQIMDCKEWAEKKEKEAFEKERQDILELNILRQEKLGSEGFRKEKMEFVTNRIAEMLKKELDIGKECDQTAHLDGKMKNLETANSEIRASVSAVEMGEEEMTRNLKQAVKREREEFKRIEKFEKQICKFQGHIHEEQEKILQLHQQLHVIDEAQKETKLKLKHEQEEREKANNLLIEERKLTRIAKENANKRLESLKQSLEMEQKLVMDDKRRLIEELSSFEVPYIISNENDESSSSSSVVRRILEESEKSQDNSIAHHEQADEMIPDHRLCILCLEKEVCVLFMPCAHQIVCHDCSATVENYCPCCEVKIEKQIRVYGGNS